MSNTQGQLFILSGPSGSGKDTVLKLLLEQDPNLFLSISSITRDMRPGEVAGEKYNFISRAEFEEMLQNNMLLEHNVYLGNYYGTPRLPVEQSLAKGKDVILEIDVNGANKVRNIMPQAVSVFIMPPSFAVLKQRLVGRGTEEPAVIEKRLAQAIEEIRQAYTYDYIVVNDVLDRAAQDLQSVIAGERCKINRKKHIIDEVLKDVES